MFERLRRRDSDEQAGVVGEADVFAGEHDHATGDEAGIFAGFEQILVPEMNMGQLLKVLRAKYLVNAIGLNKIKGFRCRMPKGAFYAFPNVKRTGWKAKELATALLNDTGVVTIGGPDFGILGEGYLRLSYANSTENILKALARMNEFLSKRKAA